MQTKNRISCSTNREVVSRDNQSSNKSSAIAAVANAPGVLKKPWIFAFLRALERLKYQRTKQSELSSSSRLLGLDNSILLSDYGRKVVEMLLEPRELAKSGRSAQDFGNYVEGQKFTERKEIVLPLSSPCHDILEAECSQHTITRELSLTTKEDAQSLQDQGSTTVVNFVDQKQSFHSRTGSEASLFSTPVESSSFSSRSETGSFTKVEPQVVGILSSESSRKSCSHSTVRGAVPKFFFSNLNPEMCARRSSGMDAINRNYIEFTFLDGRLVESESKFENALLQKLLESSSSYVIEKDCGNIELKMQKHSESLNNSVKEDLKVDTIGRPLLICSTSENNSGTSSTKNFTGSFKLLPEELQNICSDSFDFRGSKFAEGSLKTDVLLKTLSSTNCLDEVDSSHFACRFCRDSTTDLNPCPHEVNSTESFDVKSPLCELTTADSQSVSCTENISAQKMCSKAKLLCGQNSLNIAPVETQPKNFSQDGRDSTSVVKITTTTEVRPFLGSPSKQDSYVTSGIRRKAPPLDSVISQRSLSECLMSPRERKSNVSPKALHFRSANSVMLDTVIFQENTLNWCTDSQDNVPAFKTNRCIPTPKIAFCSRKPRLATSKQGDASKRFPWTERPFDPSTVVEGRLHCMVEDGAASYSLLLNGSDHVLTASTLRIESLEQQELTYAFYSLKGKGKGIVGWKNWRKKERSASTFLGSMKLTSKFSNENEHPNSGTSSFVNLEFVFLGNEEKEQLPSFCSPRESISCQASMFSESPQSLNTSPSRFSPISEIFHKLSPAPTMLGLPSPRLYDSPFSSHYVSLGMIPRSLFSPLTTVRSSKVGRNPRSGSSHCSPASTNEEEERNTAKKVWIDLCGTNNTAMGCTNKSYLECVAAVIRMPLEADASTTLGDTLNLGQKWGWEGKYLNRNKTLTNGRNGCFSTNLEKAEENNSNQCLSADKEHEPQTCVDGLGIHCKLDPDSSCRGNVIGNCLRSNSKGREISGLRLATQEFRDVESKGQVTVTVILPAGKHGRPLSGMTGPQPLIDRWRSGGNCDCGSWDLGCGFTVLDSELPINFTSDENFLAEETPATEMKSKCSTLKMFMQAKKHQGAIMGLTPLQDGLYSLTFRSPLSALQAFASSVAILYSMGSMMPVIKQEAAKLAREPPRIPLQPLTTSVFPTSQEHMAISPWRRLYGEYSNPDPPLSPIERL